MEDARTAEGSGDTLIKAIDSAIMEACKQAGKNHRIRWTLKELNGEYDPETGSENYIAEIEFKAIRTGW